MFDNYPKIKPILPKVDKEIYLSRLSGNRPNDNTDHERRAET